MRCFKTAKMTLFILGFTALSSAVAQTWNYQAYNDKGPTAMGHITLQEKGGKYTFQLFAGLLDQCQQSSMPATVEQTDTTITVTPVFHMAGCGAVRYVMKKDGTGGVRETKSGDQWRADRRDRVLTLKP